MTIAQRPLGNSGVTVSGLGFGAMELRGAGHMAGSRPGRPLGDEDAAAVLNAALDAGVTFVDTSADYGTSEEVIGAALSGRRGEFRLATKCGCPLADDPSAPRPLKHDYSRANMTAVLERSLGRLRTDHVDLLQFHASPTMSRLQEDDAIATVLDFQQQGKVRFIGMSAELPNLAEHVASGIFAAFQIPYSVLQRAHEKVIAEAAAHGAGVIIRGSIARGLPSGDGPWTAPWDQWAAAALDELLDDGDSRADFMLRYVLSNDGVSTAIVGTLSPSHVQANARAAARGPLPADVVAEVNRRLDAVAADAVPEPA